MIGPARVDLPKRAPMPATPLVDLARSHARIGEELRAAFERVLGASAFILGEEVERFEAEFAAYCGVRHCVGVASGTAALALMLKAAGIGAGDQVIVPAHTFITTALAVRHAAAQPVPVDVEPASGLIDPNAAAAAIGPRTVAIIAVHLYGQPCAMEPLRMLARRHSLLLLEDAAQAHGASYRGVRAGALCTDDDGLARTARRLRDLGRDGGSDHLLAGYNERLDGLQAALLRVKLAHLDAWNAERRALAASYRRLLDGHVQLLGEVEEASCVYHIFPIRLTGRDGLAAALRAAGIATGVHYPRALVDQPILRKFTAAAPAARDWAARELSLPIFPAMRECEVAAVADLVVRYLG